MQAIAGLQNKNIIIEQAICTNFYRSVLSVPIIAKYTSIASVIY